MSDQAEKFNEQDSHWNQDYLDMIDESLKLQQPRQIPSRGKEKSMSNQKMKSDEQYSRLVTEEVFREKMKAKQEVLSYRRDLWIRTSGRLIQALCFALSIGLILGWVIGPQIFHGWFPKFQWLLSSLAFVASLAWYIRK